MRSSCQVASSGWAPSGRRAIPATARDPVHDVELRRLPHRSVRGHQRTLRRVRRRNRLHAPTPSAYGWSFVFAGLLPDDFPDTRAVASAPWWRQVYGADWRHPEGPQSDLDGRGDHPVVHVSWHDAVAFCAWTGTRACRPKPSGSTRRVAAGPASRSRGATTSSPAASTA